MPFTSMMGGCKFSIRAELAKIDFTTSLIMEGRGRLCGYPTLK